MRIASWFRRLALSHRCNGHACAGEAGDKREKSTAATSAGCQAYQQAADGTWNQLPCGEPGANGATNTVPRPGADDER